MVSSRARQLVLVALALLVVFVSAWMITLSSVPKATIATGSSDGVYYQIGASLDAAMGSARVERPVTLEVLETAGSVENINRLTEGSVDFGLIQGALPLELESLAAVANIDRQFAFVLVRKDSKIRSFAELSGGRLGLGREHSGENMLGSQILAQCAFNPAVEAVRDSYRGMLEALDAGTLDGALFVLSLNSRFMHDALGTGRYRLIPIEEAQALSRTIPGLYAESVPRASFGPRGEVPDEDLTTVAVSTLLITREDTPDDTVERVLEVLYDTYFIKTAHLAGLNEDSGARVLDLPLHAAASAYYTRNEPLTSDMFEIASAVLGVLIAAVSAVSYLIRVRDQRVLEERRLAINPYFKQMLQFGEEVEQTTDIAELRHLVGRMMTTQRDAERAWLDGKLDTEHMENLYLVYNIRSRNTFAKIHKLQNKLELSLLTSMAGLLAELARRSDVEIPIELTRALEATRGHSE